MGCGQSGSPKKNASEPEQPKKRGSDNSRNSSSKDNQPAKEPKMTADGTCRIVMGKYKMNMGKEDIMGEGTSSICRKGTVMESGNAVAIKVYKGTVKSGSKAEDVMMLKFRRQVQVLTDLQAPFRPVGDKTLWNEMLAAAKPSSLFMTLIDYSKDAKGEPAADPGDGVVYVITELAQYSLKDYFALRREQSRPLPKESVKSIARAIILVVAGLHAKGLAHMDLKPENLMMFNGRLKLIDVDGCVKIGTTVSITDSSISFSPCYCAPEWAQFLISENNQGIVVAPHLDVWSVGMTICELVTLNAILKPMYGNFLRNAHSHREAGFLFMDWLSGIKKVPLPKNIEKFDPDFVDLLNNWLLVCDKKARKSCAQCLTNPYIASAAGREKKESQMDMPNKDEQVPRRDARAEDDSKAHVYKGVLFKLDTNGDPMKLDQWRQRDMWITKAGSLCYFSSKDNKRLILIEASKLAGAKIKRLDKSAKEWSFEVSADDDKQVYAYFATQSEQEYNEWTERLKGEGMAIPTMQLGNHVTELRKFVITVKNRRQKVDEDHKDQFAPVFKANLWKLKAEGDRMKPEDWFEREMWVAKNGSLVYYSKKEERDLVYYTSEDLSRATYTKLKPEDSCKPYTFQVHLAQCDDDVEFAPGEFSTETEEMRDRWIAEFKKFQTKA
mmetsp:Transcript_62375/g.118423  ORF Transcript_62375/g.118423 Transcript_62375/m.118423 type:complete len:667 (+) Transcript_62375:40-2040(+)